MTAQMNREEILHRFEQLLDSALAEEAPSGIDPEILSALAGDDAGDDSVLRRCDSFALWAALTALTQEVKLQGRAFQELNHTLDAQTGRLLEEIRAAYAERERNLQREVERHCRREALNALIDLRDRLCRGRESARARELEARMAARAGWLRRLFRRPDRNAAETVGALVRGYELGMERLDQTLDEFNAREIRCEGEIFDPRRMNAIDSQEAAGVAEGTVLEVYRSGYEWNGEVFRPAQVKVSRAPRAPDDGKSS
jgi:molecular chaperone GrpE (heat shock protein)